MNGPDREPLESPFTGPLRGSGIELERATLKSLDALEDVLRLEPLGDSRFRAHSEPSRFGRIFGGQLLAQAMVAAGATVEGQAPYSLHACFVGVGASDVPLEITVEHLRDGRSMSTRQVRITQQGRVVFTALVSCRTASADPPRDGPRSVDSQPEALPLLQHWVERAAPHLLANARTWVDIPPPLEMRMDEAPTFLSPSHAQGTRSHWLRLPRSVGDDPALHEALLLYASDYLLLDMAFRAHPAGATYRTHTGLSLDHAFWLHGTVNFDEWHLYIQDTVSVTGDRALVRGALFDTAGFLVASTAQEVLIRPTASQSGVAKERR